MKLAILDKDGTITASASGATFTKHPEDQELLLGVKEAVARLVADGYTLVIASNQGGVEAGYKSLDGAIAEMRYCMELLPAIETAYFCPDFAGQRLHTCYNLKRNWHVVTSTADEATNFRKPNPGMIQMAIANFSPMFNLLESIVFVGDRPEDQLAAQTAGIPFLDAAEWRNGAVIPA